jgi:osmotically-inducible protein OsmY
VPTAELHCAKPAIADGRVVELLWEIRVDPALRRKHMAHNGNEYEIRVTYEDGTEELSGWMNSAEQLAHAMATVHRSQGRAYWLLVRVEDQIILESPITDIPSPRYSTHDSHYKVRVRSRDRYASGF